MKLMELINIRKALPLDAKKAGIQTKYKIVRFLKATQNDAEFYENEVGKIISDCAEKTEDGKQIVQNESGILISDDKKEQFIAQMAELATTEVTCPALELSLAEADALELTVENLLTIDQFITDAKAD